MNKGSDMIKLTDRWIGRAGECWLCKGRDSIAYLTTFVYAADVMADSATGGRRGEMEMLFAYVPICLECTRKVRSVGLSGMGWSPTKAGQTLRDLLTAYPLRRKCSLCDGEGPLSCCACAGEGTVAWHAFGAHLEPVLVYEQGLLTVREPTAAEAALPAGASPVAPVGPAAALPASVDGAGATGRRRGSSGAAKSASGASAALPAKPLTGRRASAAAAATKPKVEPSLRVDKKEAPVGRRGLSGGRRVMPPSPMRVEDADGKA